MYKLKKSFSIIDNNNKFILTDKDKHLVLEISDERKTQIYSIIKGIKDAKGARDTDDNTSFREKFIKLLLKYEFVSKEDKPSEYIDIDFNCICTDKQVSKYIKSLVELESDKFTTKVDFIDDFKNATKTNIPLFISIQDDSILISNQDFFDGVYVEKDHNDLYLKYASSVIVNQLILGNISKVDFDKYLIRIDLSIYTNEIKKFVLNEVNHLNFLESIFNIPEVSKFNISFNYDKFFPLVEVSYINEANQFFGIGFNEMDCVNNLLYILKDRIKMSNRINLTDLELNHELNNSSFLKKIANVYFSSLIDENKVRHNEIELSTRYFTTLRNTKPKEDYFEY